MINLFLFITFAFPKAGIKIAGIPITIQIILFVICTILSIDILKTIYTKTKMRNFTLMYILFSMTLLCSLIINFENIKSFYFLSTMVLIMSPIAIVIGYKADYEKTMKIICIALIITGIYSILQWNIGLEATKIPGLNIAYGDSFENKPIGYGFNGVEALKMPSTYQNGNLVGLFYILGIACMIDWRGDKRYAIIKVIAIILGTFGIILTGSRTIMICYIIMILSETISLIIRNKSERKKYFKIIGIAMILLMIVGSIFLIKEKETVERLVDRYIITTISDKTATGRTTQVEMLFKDIEEADIIEKIRILFLGMDWANVKSCEGLLYILAFYGGIAFISIIAMFVIIIKLIYKSNSIIGLALIAVFISFMVDSSFNYPPILINYFLIVGIYIRKKHELSENIEKDEIEVV